MTIDQIWDAIKQEKQVNWHNGIYEVYSVPVEKKNPYNSLSFRNGEAIRIECTQNGFGGFIAESELKDVYITNL